MESNITLRLKDSALRDEYFARRSKEIKMSILILSLMLFSFVLMIVISIVLKWNEYIVELWTGRIICVIVNASLIFFQHKYPVKMAPYHGPILLLN